MGDPKNGTTAALTEDVLAPVHYSPAAQPRTIHYSRGAGR